MQKEGSKNELPLSPVKQDLKMMRTQLDLRAKIFERICVNPRAEALAWELQLNEGWLIRCKDVRWIPEEDGYALVDATHTYVYSSKYVLRLYYLDADPDTITIPTAYFPHRPILAVLPGAVFAVVSPYLHYLTWYDMSEVCKSSAEFFHGPASPFHALWASLQGFLPRIATNRINVQEQLSKRIRIEWGPWTLLRQLRPKNFIQFLKTFRGRGLLELLLPSADFQPVGGMLYVYVGEAKYRLTPMGLKDDRGDVWIYLDALYSMLPDVIDRILKEKLYNKFNDYQ
jgi:hypothetical protein